MLRLDGLRLQLLGLFVLPVTVVVLAVAVAATGIHRQAMRGLVAERDERSAASSAAAVEAALQERLTLIGALASLATSGAPAGADQLIDNPLPQAFSAGYAVYDRSGRLLAGADLRTDIDLDPLPQPSDSPQVLIQQVEGDSVVVFIHPGRSAVALGTIKAGDLVRSGIQPQIGSSSEVRAYIVAPGPTLIFSAGGPAPVDLTSHAGVQAALRGERGSSFLPMPDGEHVVAFAPIASAGWGLIIEEPWESVSSSLLDLSLLAPFSMLPILLLTLVALWFGARRVIEPLRRLEEAASQLPSAGMEAIAQPTGGIAEIEHLRQSLARMAVRVREAQTALRAYIAVITNAQEEERRRVARELHDESIQHWIALDQRLQMAAARLRQQGNAEADLLAELHQQVQAGVHGLRRLSRGLRPIYLEDLGLVPAIEMLARDSEEALGIGVELQIQGEQHRLSPEAELAVYRLVQEGLNNVARHAHGSSAQVGLLFTPNHLQVTVADDGRGFNPPDLIEELARAGHYGLMGMQERADALGGTLTIESAHDSGTTVRLSIPLSRHTSAP
jgi:signal transduction histidine kinase